MTPYRAIGVAVLTGAVLALCGPVPTAHADGTPETEIARQWT
jgi:hypothetical protein